MNVPQDQKNGAIDEDEEPGWQATQNHFGKGGKKC